MSVYVESQTQSNFIFHIIPVISTSLVQLNAVVVSQYCHGHATYQIVAWLCVNLLIHIYIHTEAQRMNEW